ncbi:hypothetical protein J1605_020431 [Eschrichtius robustus]|uniref:Ion transport domain-containing protein n=1 Tax=Eschrichtius robustus TaxID=9764 RepID=A0AB34HJF3_ESCRO|nr:hypothetical protein J1605_020431 [Eschrichtius robustus]
MPGLLSTARIHIPPLGSTFKMSPEPSHDPLHCHVIWTSQMCIIRMAGMRILVNLLLDTLPMLGNVLLLCFFVFFIFGIIGVQLWAGLLRNRCFLGENVTM